MILNYIKIAWRNFGKNAVYSFQNIFGLTIAFSISLLAILYVAEELNFDRFYKNASRIYRVNTDIKVNDYVQSAAVSSDVVGPLLKETFPQVESYVRFFASNQPFLVKKGNDFLEESNAAYIDSTLFDVFSIAVVNSGSRRLLWEPNSVVITQSVAKKYFGETQAVGKTLEMDKNGNDIRKKNTYIVSAVIADFKGNSHFSFDFIFPMANLAYGWGNYAGNNFHTYVLLKKETDYHTINQALDMVVKKRIFPYFIQQFGLNVESWEKFNSIGNKIQYSLYPITDIHLMSGKSDELKSGGGNLQLTYIISLLVFFVLLIACINFSNLSVVHAAGRAREIGIRKVMGSNRRSLMFQFLFEAIALVLVAMLLAILITLVTLPYFNEIMQKSFSAGNLINSRLMLTMLILVLLVGILAACYPAFYLSRLNPTQALQGKTNLVVNKSVLTKILVVFQFSVSITLIVGTIVIYSQLNHIRNRDIGYTKEQVLVINNMNYLGKNALIFKNEVLKIPGITSGSLTSSLPVNSSQMLGSFTHNAARKKYNIIQGRNWFVDNGYVKTMGMSILKGRDFSSEYSTNYQSVLINEEMAGKLGVQNPVGEKIHSEIAEYTIIGVVKNFNYESLREPVGPVILNFNDKSGDFAAFRIGDADMKDVISQINTVWKKLELQYPFNYYFMDDAFDNIYRADQTMGKISITATILAILIACTGLFGLIAYASEKRRKEIGIRKVMGASVAQITMLLSKDFLSLVLIAFIIASPIAWYAMHTWLQGFAYRITISWWMFALAGLLAILIALITISFQAIKAAVANPVKSLRTE